MKGAAMLSRFLAVFIFAVGWRMVQETLDSPLRVVVPKSE
jgi:hypothetical protein